MDLDDWVEERTFHHSRFRDIGRLVELKREQGLTISLCLPALNEAATIGKEIAVLRRALVQRHPLLDEIVVVDSGSTDRTQQIAARHGALVYAADECLPELESLRGKGENLWKSLFLCQGDLIVWVDSDIRNIHPKFVYGLIGPLLENPEIGYVKAFYKRPIRAGRRLIPGGGRVTELLVRPFLNLFWVDLSVLAQPLSGEYAGRRRLLERMPFFSGYGVEIGLLIDIERRFGVQAMAQVDMDERIHRNQSIESLRRMSFAILSVLITRTEEVGKLALLQGLGPELHLIRRDGGMYLHDHERVHGRERPPMITIPAYQKKRGIEEEHRALIEGFHAPTRSLASVSHLMKESLIELDLQSRTRDEALRDLVALVRRSRTVRNPEAVLELLMRRESQTSTGLGRGIAIPHAVCADVNEPVILVGRSIPGVEFSAVDHKPVHLIFVILAPETHRGPYLEILASLALLLRQRNVAAHLLAAESEAEALSILRKHETIVRLSRELEDRPRSAIG